MTLIFWSITTNFQEKFWERFRYLLDFCVFEELKRPRYVSTCAVRNNRPLTHKLWSKMAAGECRRMCGLGNQLLAKCSSI
jgi:hypothetical protein